MTVECNNIRFDICINRADLLGDPAVAEGLKVRAASVSCIFRIEENIRAEEYRL